MAGKPLISVIICFLNAEKFIQEAVESVIHQTYDNWELLLVDDGSTDNSTRIAKAFAERSSSRTFYLEHEGHQNKGLSASRNLGIKHAKGEYLAFLDSDDIWLPQNLERQLEFMVSNPDVDMVCGPGQFWYSWTGNQKDLSRDFILEPGGKPGFSYRPLSLLPRYLQDERTVPLICCVLVKRELLERIGGFEETFRGLYEDQVIFAKISIEASVFVHGECMSRYRQHPNSLCAIAVETSSDKNGLYHSLRLQFLNWLESYLSRKRILNLRVWRILKKELLPYRHPAIHHLVTRTSKSVSSYPRKIINKIIPNQVKSATKKLLRYKTSQGLE